MKVWMESNLENLSWLLLHSRAGKTRAEALLGLAMGNIYLPPQELMPDNKIAPASWVNPKDSRTIWADTFRQNNGNRFFLIHKKIKKELACDSSKMIPLHPLVDVEHSALINANCYAYGAVSEMEHIIVTVCPECNKHTLKRQASTNYISIDFESDGDTQLSQDKERTWCSGCKRFKIWSLHSAYKPKTKFFYVLPL